MTDAEYLEIDLFEGDEGEMAMRSARLLTTRKPHLCSVWSSQHENPSGTKARLETALVDGSFWGRYYACLPCLDRWAKEIYGDGEGEE